MRGVFRGALAATAAVVALTLPPGSASAKGSCIFDELKATERNRDLVERSQFCLTNLHRVRSGVGPVAIDTRLMAAARDHSIDMISRGFYSHTNPEGLGPFARATAAGYPFGTGENIATAQEGTAQKLLDLLRNSQAHNDNMLASQYKAAGIGVENRCCPGLGDHAGITATEMFGIGPANTGDDALDFYASSGKCAKAMEGVILKRKARKRARGAKRRRLSDQIRVLKKDVNRRCKALNS